MRYENSMTSTNIIVLGAGAWGTALANLYAERASVTLWCRRTEQAEKIALARENMDYLPGITLHKNLRITADAQAIRSADIILSALPAQHTITQLQSLQPYLPAAVPLIICAKGILVDEQKLLPAGLVEIFPEHKIAILSGPNLAHEIARGLPAAATLAAADEATAQHLAGQLRTPHFRPYVSTDMTGVALAGALKNVIALAAGMVMGAGLGENARAAIITRGMAEVMRLGQAMGARPETFMGLAGIGDMMLTCHAVTSRNYSCGFALGRGESLSDIMAARHGVTEGVTTTPAALALAGRYHIEMPICAAVQSVLTEQKTVGAALAELMARPLKGE
jgi:glycerol-3-phosphate dehydrogenase (NAD(P)+)